MKVSKKCLNSCCMKQLENENGKTNRINDATGLCILHVAVRISQQTGNFQGRWQLLRSNCPRALYPSVSIF